MKGATVDAKLLTTGTEVIREGIWLARRAIEIMKWARTL